MCTAPQFTVIVADELLLLVLASTVAETVAVLLRLGQSLAVVARLGVTVRGLPLVIAPKLQDRKPPAVIEQEAAVVPLGDQVTAGGGSRSGTLGDVTVPAAGTRTVEQA